ncbi:MAG: succinylglutamate desuccinylase/aspartoacylase family protein, partial [Pseudomonadota bacterium]
PSVGGTDGVSILGMWECAGLPSLSRCIILVPRFTISEIEGLIEPMADLGETVEQGQLLARIWPKDRTGVDPVEYYAKRTGILAGRHFPGLVKMGDCIAVVGVKS